MAIDASAVARVLGIDTNFRDLRAGGALFLPQRIAVLAQGASSVSYSTDKFTPTSAFEVGQKLGFGSPAHLIAQQLFPADGDGIGTIPADFFPLEDAYEAVAATGTITPTGSQLEADQYRVVINNIKSEPFVIDEDDTVSTICDSIVAAINGTPEMPVTAADGGTVVTVTAKWAGPSGNAIHIEIQGEDHGVEFAISQPSGGLVNPSLESALAKFGTVWETMVLNALDINDTDALDELQEAGEARWGQLVRKPFIAFTGNTATTVSAATAVSSTRRDDRINAQLVAPGSKDLPFVVAARQLARIARVANNNPPTDYGAQRATGLTPGADEDQWSYAQRDQAVKLGSSTIEVKDGVVCLSDIVTFYRPSGDPTPAYRYVVDIVKLQNIIYNFGLEFEKEEWAGAPLIPDSQPTVNPNARKPKAVKAAACAILDGLGLQAIISDPEFAKANTVAVIDSQNPKRVNLQTTVKLAGNTNIISADLFFGFYFGQAVAA